LYFAVVCSEDVPFYDPAELQKDRATAVVGEDFSRSCRFWPRAPLPVDYKKPVVSQVPVLLLSGELDPVTPPANGELARRTLRHSLHLVAPGQGHIVINRGCLPKIAAQFIDQGQVENLKTSCLQDLKPLPFFLTFAGPAP
jgi:pimeloyl-ACP methyl ester carboxylesterase